MSAQHETKKNGKVILAIGTHFDDCEYGAGGVLLKAIKAGHQVIIVNTVGDYSWCHSMKRKRFSIRNQVLLIAGTMGARKILLRYKHMNVPNNYQIKHQLALLVKKYKPDIGLIHWPHDYWSDHAVTGAVSLDALMHPGHFLDGSDVSPVKEIYAYECGPNQTIGFKPDTHVDISDTMAEIMGLLSKLDAAAGEKLEDTQDKPSWHAAEKKAAAWIRGLEIGVDKAVEAFVAVRKLPLQNL